MSFKDKIVELWQREAAGTVYGWIHSDPSAAPQALPPVDARYVKVSCSEFRLKFDRERAAGRAPVFVSQVEWPVAGERITITKTLGPTNFTSFNESEFITMVHSSVSLTDALPFESGSIELRAALISVPQSSLLDRATRFLDDLADLTQVPQLTAAAPIASKIAAGVDGILGNDESKGLIAFMTTLDLDDARSGYYVVTNWKENDQQGLAQLSVRDDRLFVSQGGEPQRAAGFDYILLKIAIVGSQVNRWRSIKPVVDLWELARSSLSKARSAEQVSDAGHALLLAIDRTSLDANLTAQDRAITEAQLERDWVDAVQRRVRVLEAEAPPQQQQQQQQEQQQQDQESGGRPGLDDEVPTSIEADEVRRAGNDIRRRLQSRMAADQRHAAGRGLVR